MNLVNQMANYYMNNQMQNLTANLENQLKQNNLQMYQFYQAARQQNANPNDLIKQLAANYDEATKKRFKEQGKQFGLTDELLNHI